MRAADLRRHLAPLLVACGLFVAGASVAVGVLGRGRPVHRGTVPTASAPSGRPAPLTRETARAGSAPTASLPTGLDIGQLAVSAPVVPVSVLDGALDVPDDVRTVGWWVGGALPGAATGTVVIDGHVDSATAGRGSLFNLRALRVGATIVITGDPDDVRYRVTGLREYDKADLPAALLFVRTGAARLVLITCGGPFDASTRHYRDNVVAFAVPVVS